jgi:Spy/CpxP family protein refolding chaperone
MFLRKLGLAVAITALSVLSVAAMEESASAGRRSGHHHHHGHHKRHEHHGVKKCYHTSHGFQCYYLKSR